MEKMAILGLIVFLIGLAVVGIGMYLGSVLVISTIQKENGEGVANFILGMIIICTSLVIIGALFSPIII